MSASPLEPKASEVSREVAALEAAHFQAAAHAPAVEPAKAVASPSHKASGVAPARTSHQPILGTVTVGVIGDRYLTVDLPPAWEVLPLETVTLNETLELTMPSAFPTLPHLTGAAHPTPNTIPRGTTVQTFQPIAHELKIKGYGR